jgi:hypothetical protein
MRRAGAAGDLLARLRRLHRLRRVAAPGAAVHRGADAIPIRIVESAVILPYVEIGRSARLQNVVVDSRRDSIPEGLVVGEDPELDAKRFRRTEQGHLPDHAAHDRQARA